MASTMAIGDRNLSHISRNFNISHEDSLGERDGEGFGCRFEWKDEQGRIIWREAVLAEASGSK
jgi:hypothetical protein